MPESLFRKIKGVLGLKALDKQKGTQIGFPFLSTLRNSTLMIFPFCLPPQRFAHWLWGFRRCRRRLKSRKRQSAFLSKAKLFTLNVDDLLATIEAVRADVVTKMNFTGLRFNSRSRVRQEVMSAMVAALVGRFFILLDCHSNTPLFENTRLYPRYAHLANANT